MRGVVFRKAGCAEMTEKPLPVLSAGEATVKMSRVGVCGTDIQVFMGKNKFMKFPIVPFHEGIGTIHEAYEDVTDLSAGDLVAIKPIIPCGHCRACLKGSNNACESFNCLGVQSDGLGDEYFKINRRFIYKLSEGISLDKAVLIEPFAVGVHAARRANAKGGNVFVIGGGTIGNFTAQACKLAGAEKTAICDVSEDKLELARKSGIALAVNTSRKSLKEAIHEAFDGQAADAIIDCVGAPYMLPQILDAACKASTVVIVGNYSEPVEIDVTKIQRNELDVNGCITYTDEDFLTAVRSVESQKVFTDGFITGRYSISDIQAGMENAVSFKGQNMKTVFTY